MPDILYLKYWINKSTLQKHIMKAIIALLLTCSLSVGGMSIFEKTESVLHPHKDNKEQFNKEFLIDAALRVILARQRMEPVAHDTWQVDVLDKGDLVDAALRGGCLLRRAEGEVNEDTSEVGPQLFLDEIGVHLRVKVLHVEQVDQGCSCAHRWR